MNEPRTPGESIAIGIVRAAHGLDGALKIESLSGEHEHFMRVAQITLRKGEREQVFSVKEVRSAGRWVVLSVDGIGDVDQAKKWTGAEVVVPRSDAVPAEEGEYYYADLVGCTLTLDGKAVGTVAAVIELPHCHALEVTTGTRNQVLVPFQDVFVGRVDLVARTVELVAGWLLE